MPISLPCHFDFTCCALRLPSDLGLFRLDVASNSLEARFKCTSSSHLMQNASGTPPEARRKRARTHTVCNRLPLDIWTPRVARTPKLNDFLHAAFPQKGKLSIPVLHYRVQLSSASFHEMTQHPDNIGKTMC